MKFTAVIDVAAFIWDEHQFNIDETQFYSVIDSIPSILNFIIKERIPVAFRLELFDEVQSNFPYRFIPQKFSDFRKNTISQLTKLKIIDYPNTNFTNLTCDPSLIRDHFSDSTQQELTHLISYLYSENESVQKLLTFSLFWQDNRNVIISNGNSKEVETELCDDKNRHREITNSLKKIFEHNPKHRQVARIVNGKKASALRCYNTGLKDTTKAQKILDSSVFVEGSFYGYDSDHETYVRFLKTEKNLFHGFEITPDSKLEEKIKKTSKNG